MRRTVIASGVEAAHRHPPRKEVEMNLDRIEGNWKTYQEQP